MQQVQHQCVASFLSAAREHQLRAIANRVLAGAATPSDHDEMSQMPHTELSAVQSMLQSQQM